MKLGLHYFDYHRRSFLSLWFSLFFLVSQYVIVKRICNYSLCLLTVCCGSEASNPPILPLLHQRSSSSVFSSHMDCAVAICLLRRHPRKWPQLLSNHCHPGQSISCHRRWPRWPARNWTPSASPFGKSSSKKGFPSFAGALTSLHAAYYVASTFLLLTSPPRVCNWRF